MATDILWMSSGWQFLVPMFQQEFEKAGVDASIRIAKRGSDGNVDIADLKGAHILVPAMEPCGKEHADACIDTLKLVYQPAVGYDNVDVEALKALSIPVCHAPGSNANAVAEAALLLIMSISRKLKLALRNVQQGTLGAPPGLELKGLNLGIIGISGASGSILADICRGGFGMQVSGTTSRTTREEFVTLLRTSDVISVHCTLNDATRGMFGESEFALMKPTALLVSVARGAVIERQAVEKALNSKQIAGFAFDCFWEEPAPPEDPFHQREDVFFTPHFCSATWQFYQTISNLAVSNTTAVVNGKLSELKHRL